VIKKRKIKERNGIRKTIFVLLMLSIVCFYLCGQYYFKWNWITETVVTIVTIISAVAFWLEYRENKLLNEAQFITELNQQFVSNEKMYTIEWELEKFYNKHRNGELSEEDITNFKKKFNIEQKSRQHLVNYLVHLEGIAALVKNKVIQIRTIDDLMSYRYFIAVNNPAVQELELNEYPEYYKGCFDIYDDWVKILLEQDITPPMHESFKLK